MSAGSDLPTDIPVRVRVLMDIGLRDLALVEIIEGRYTPPERCLCLGELELWDRAIRCASENGISALMYPLAHWEKIREISEALSIDPYLILSIIRQESMFREDALSRAGAMGLMQLMPYTARRIADSIGISLDEGTLLEPETNILLGVHYLKGLLEEFQNPVAAIAAYNAGPQRVRKWLSQSYSGLDEFIEDIPFPETRNYVKRVITGYYRYRSLYEPVPAQKLLIKFSPLSGD